MAERRERIRGQASLVLPLELRDRLFGSVMLKPILRNFPQWPSSFLDCWVTVFQKSIYVLHVTLFPCFLVFFSFFPLLHPIVCLLRSLPLSASSLDLESLQSFRRRRSLAASSDLNSSRLTDKAALHWSSCVRKYLYPIADQIIKKVSPLRGVDPLCSATSDLFEWSGNG